MFEQHPGHTEIITEAQECSVSSGQSPHSQHVCLLHTLSCHFIRDTCTVARIGVKNKLMYMIITEVIVKGGVCVALAVSNCVGRC